MAASMKNIVFSSKPCVWSNCGRGPLTYCKRLFHYRSLSINSNDRFNNVITRDSKVDEVALDSLIGQRGDSEYVKYKIHPGAIRQMRIQLPIRLFRAIKILLEKYPLESLSDRAETLVRYLAQRQPPACEKQINKKAVEIENKLLEKDPHKFDNLSETDLDIAIANHKKVVLSRLRSNVYHWKPMQYDAFTSYMYLVGRMTFDFSVLTQCFTEIVKRDAQFRPTSLYYFGSKVGACIWASDKLWTSIGEHYCVDTSDHMNTIAQLLLQGGNEQEPVMSINGVHFRKFQPSAKENKFSIVVSPFMLMEQPSQEERIHLLLHLWEMAETYLILVENGTSAGFSLINEAKEFLLEASFEDNDLLGHVFAPCPHDKTCPKLQEKDQPCLTECFHKEVDYTSDKWDNLSTKKARYSYVILKKGRRETEAEWPRVLQQVKAKKHTHCHLCLPNGSLQHVVITKGKFDKYVYGCARYVTQGDCLPVSLSHDLQEETRAADQSFEELEDGGKGA